MGPWVVQGWWGIPAPWLVGKRWWKLLVWDVLWHGMSSPARAPFQMPKEHDICPRGLNLDSLGSKNGGSPALSHWGGDTQ